MDTTLPNRQSIRLKGWDYSSPGRYFVTINTHEGRALFGTILKGRMVLSAAGRIAEDCWCAIPKHFPQACVEEHVIMPNHMHGIIELQGQAIARPYACPRDRRGRIRHLAPKLLGCDCAE